MSADPLALQLRAGRIRGRREAGVRRFLGIPYASPPLGPLRFAPPQPPRPWQGVRDATAHTPAPLQRADPLSRQLGLLDDPPQSEDCLHLNVFVPDPAGAEPLPVMVWLHGGAFASGTARGPAYDGSRLAGRGRVVVVTLDYRVGALGFLGTGAPNLGLQDQLAALRFVRDEIAGFGGDPARVTVFGESAGAGSLACLLAMPAAAGLFQRAILQSPAPEGVLTGEEAAERARLFSEAAGTPEGDLEALRALPAGALLEAQAKCQEPGPRRIGMFFAPVVDGTALPEAPLAAVARGAARDVDVVIGTTAQEMQLYHLSDLVPDIPDAALPQVFAARLGGSLERARALLALYDPAALPGKDRFFALETDASLFVPSAELAGCQARHNPRTFMYRFCHPSPLAGGRLGACHALDVPFVLGTLDRAPEFAGTDPAAQRLSEALQDAWSGFARSGDPACEGTGPWPAYDAERRATLFLDAPCRVVLAPDEGRRAAWAAAKGYPAA